jgi:hypothetical protein
MAKSENGGTNVATLQPNRNLLKLRADLKKDGALRKELTENPAAVLNKYGLSVALPTGTMRRISAGGIFTISGTKVHLDQHADGHLDVDPHIDENPHIDLG